MQRPRAAGKWLHSEAGKWLVRGVTYGTFPPNSEGHEYPRAKRVESDFRAMAERGLNAVRVYTAPPRWLLDTAERHGLRVLIGLGAERTIGYLCEGQWGEVHEAPIVAAVRELAGHPAVLAYAIGNEIPGSIVRWLGARRVERHLERLAERVRRADPGALVTYVNYPTTEYLSLPFLDFSCFNVYLESRGQLEAYLARLQNLAGDRPLLMTELGLDSLRHGEERQAEVIDWQIRSAFAAGCAGAFAYAWTDEWHRGGEDVHDWAFGITRRDRTPKPALAEVERAMREAPYSPVGPWPSISVVVCTHNGARTLRDCLEGLRAIEYPDFEVIVVDDGSTDASAAIAQEYCFRLVRTENRGLSSARNTGIEAARGEIVAFTDDDARPDAHWLLHLADAFRSGLGAGVGGPNIVPPADGWIAQCVAASPGGPAHVLFSDVQAEHIPGCNMAFRKSALESIRGFDPRFRTAGDDVDLCWRLLDLGERIGFAAGAMVWHHRRGSVRTYWRQQVGYGRAEALLEDKWPERYNALGHVTWGGRIYGAGLARPWPLGRNRIYHGSWGVAPYQRMYERPAGWMAAIVLTPEWYLGVLALGLVGVAGITWAPLRWAIPAALVAAAASLLQAIRSAASTRFPHAPRDQRERWGRRPLTAFLHALQPAARLTGRLRHGLVPWRRRGALGLSAPWPRARRLWCERWRSSVARLTGLERDLKERGGVTRRGSDYERWDLELRGGAFGSARLRMSVEDHARGRQLVRLRAWPRISGFALALSLGLIGLAAWASRDAAFWPAALLGGLGAVLLLWITTDAAAAMSGMNEAMKRAEREGP
jgi:GT2 family glycosyltransferase